MQTGNNILERIQELAIQKPEGWERVAQELCGKLTQYLREAKNPTPDWDKFPIARNYYGQSRNRI